MDDLRELAEAVHAATSDRVPTITTFVCRRCSKAYESTWTLAKHVQRCKARARREAEERLKHALPPVPLRVLLLFRPHFNVPATAILRESFVEPRFFFGGVQCALDRGFLVDCKIRGIVNCAVELQKLRYPVNVRVLHCPARDAEDEDIVDPYIDQLVAFAKSVEGNLFLHCQAGQSRSVTLLCALMVHDGASLLDAFAKIKQAREIAYPNRGFWRQLLAYETKVRQSSSIPTAALELHEHNF